MHLGHCQTTQPLSICHCDATLDRDVGGYSYTERLGVGSTLHLLQGAVVSDAKLDAQGSGAIPAQLVISKQLLHNF